MLLYYYNYTPVVYRINVINHRRIMITVIVYTYLRLKNDYILPIIIVLSLVHKICVIIAIAKGNRSMLHAVIS